MNDYLVIQRNARDQLGEGPLWSARENAVYWVDILAPALHRYDLNDQSVRTWIMPENIGWVIERKNAPGFMAGFKSGFAELTLDPFSITPIHNPEPHLPNNRMNDAKADLRGRIWAGTMDVGASLQTGSFYRLDTDHTVTKVDGNYTITNGPALSPDNAYMYHTDSARGLIYRFDLAADGQLHNKTKFITFASDWGKPDGMTVDAEGAIWVAHWGTGQVSRFDSDGVLERSVKLPASQITSCTFAGPKLDRMFVTSAAVDLDNEPQAGALFEIDPGVCGLPTAQFAG